MAPGRAAGSRNDATPLPRWRHGHHLPDLLKTATKWAGKSKDPQGVSNGLPERNPDTDPPPGNFPRRFQACGHKVWAQQHLGRAGFWRVPTGSDVDASLCQGPATAGTSEQPPWLRRSCCAKGTRPGRGSHAGSRCSLVPFLQHRAHGETLECLQAWKRPSGTRPQGKSTCPHGLYQFAVSFLFAGDDALLAQVLELKGVVRVMSRAADPDRPVLAKPPTLTWQRLILSVEVLHSKFWMLKSFNSELMLAVLVVNAALALATRPKSQVVKSNMEMYRSMWENHIHVLTEAVDDITSIDDFLAVSGFFPQNFLDLKNKTKPSNNSCVKEESVIGQLLISEKTPGFLVYLHSLVEHSWMMDNISQPVSKD
ncbi:uncharacterized protein LOC117011408 [Catharus ustulatus]|uniref:uncharacterized protein LOC117011408 n=1 Tax=Catharus ustulatus TaxID=91951 RepID=UPI00140D453C|nr:uncharacterized protein LOC117011408 [Catharus ustulatus]